MQDADWQEQMEYKLENLIINLLKNFFIEKKFQFLSKDSHTQIQNPVKNFLFFG